MRIKSFFKKHPRIFSVVVGVLIGLNYAAIYSIIASPTDQALYRVDLWCFLKINLIFGAMIGALLGSLVHDIIKH